MEESVSSGPMKASAPRERRAGNRGSSIATIARREQLHNNPGEWFVWRENAKTAGDTGQALRTLLAVTSIKGLDRKTLAYQSTARINEDKTWNVYVRYVGESQEFAS